MIRSLTAALVLIVWVSSTLLAEERLLPFFYDSPTRLETTARSIRNFLNGPLKDLTWNEPLYPRYSSAGANLVEMPNFEFGLLGGQRLGRYSRSDLVLSELRPLEDSYELGLFTQGRYGDYLLGSRLSRDIMGGHEGVLGEFMAGYEKKLSEKLDLSFGVGTTWAEGNYISRYNSMNTAPSTAFGLLQYTPNGKFKNASLTVSACYQLSDYWSLGAQVGYMRLLGQATDSATGRGQESENIVTGFQLQYRLRAFTGGKFRNLLRPTCHDH